jgi:hypothetical protein
MNNCDQAMKDFNELKILWEKNIEKISDRELSPFDIERVFANFDGSLAHFHLDYRLISDSDVMHEADTTFYRLRSDLHIAVQKGSQIYRHAEQDRKIALIKAYGELAKNLGINVVVLVLGILSAIVGQKIL